MEDLRCLLATVRTLKSLCIICLEQFVTYLEVLIFSSIMIDLLHPDWFHYDYLKM